MAHYYLKKKNLDSISMDQCKIFKKCSMGDFVLGCSVILTSNKHTLLNATNSDQMPA